MKYLLIILLHIISRKEELTGDYFRIAFNFNLNIASQSVVFRLWQSTPGSTWKLPDGELFQQQFV